MAQAAQPVVQHAHLHPRARAFGQRRNELAADFVITENVVSEQYVVPRTSNGFEPCVEIGAGVDQEIHAVAGGKRRAGRARQRLLRERAERCRRKLARTVHDRFHGGHVRRPRCSVQGQNGSRLEWGKYRRKVSGRSHRGFEAAMDNYQRLIEDLPARLPPGRSQRIGERSMREAVAALPLANPVQAVREVEQLLDGMLATTWAGAERIAALEHLRAPVESLCAGIERQVGAERHPLPAAAAEWAAVAQRLQWMVMCGYTVGLHELCAPAGKLPMFKTKVAAMAAVRALAHADRVLVWSYRQYQSPPAGVWRRIHALNAFAGELAVADQAVDDSLGGMPLTARTAYASLLLLAMSNPYRFSARELQEARQVVRCVASQCGLARAGGEGIGVDTDSDAGPGYIAEERLSSGSGVLSVDVSPLERMFDERKGLLAPGVDAIDLPQPGGAVLATSVRFLDRLRGAWEPAPRGYTRLSAKHALDVVVGMHALHYALAGNVDFATFVRRVHGDAITIGAHELASAWLATADTTRPQVFRADVLDQSGG